MTQPLLMANELARGVLRLLGDMGYAGVPEFPLPNSRRADVFGIDAQGRCLIVEIKTCLADYRSDTKWPEYREFADFFYFGVAATFPIEVLPEDAGLMVGDAFSATVVRRAAEQPLHASRRRALLIDAARTAAMRLRMLTDPQGWNRGASL